MEFAKACCEVEYILENLRPEDKKKLPKSVFDFFKENKAMFYKVELTTSKPLSEQKIKDETKAFLQILNYKYFASEKQKEQFKKELEEDKNIEKIHFNEENLETREIVIYKENKIKKIIKRILSFFRKGFDVK